MLSFVLNQPVPLQEDDRTEFKEITGLHAARSIIDTAEDYGVAFLNGTGGQIFWGIRDSDRLVVGVTLNARARDDVRKGVAGKFHIIQPPIDPSGYKVLFHPVVGSGTDSELCVVELAITQVAAAEPYFNHRSEAFVRINGVKQRLNGPKLTAWIRTRLQQRRPRTGTVDDPKVRELVNRVRQLFLEHGLEPGHWSPFLKVRKAPFTVSLEDLQTDGNLLAWLDEEKIDWISKTFLIRREWIVGEEARIHEEFFFDKQPSHFFSTISEHIDSVVWEEVHDTPTAYFLRSGVGKEWRRKGDCGVFFVLAVPVARFSSDRTIWKYIVDHTPYPWRYDRTYIQLRAWARLLDLNKRVHCVGSEIPFEIAEKIESNQIFLRDVIENRLKGTHDKWHPEDEALYRSESAAAKNTESLPWVIDFLRKHDLPWEEIPLGKSQQFHSTAEASKQ